MSERQRHVLGGDLEGLEFAISDYISVWGQHFGTTPHEIAGLPCAVANMAMTVIRKNLLATWEEAPLARAKAAQGEHHNGGNGWCSCGRRAASCWEDRKP